MSNKVVLILAPEADVHARSVAKALKSDFDTESRIIDLRDVARDAVLAWDHEVERYAFLAAQSGPLFLEDVISVWYRRPQRPLPDTRLEDPFDRTYVQNEWNTAFNGILQNAVPYWVNPMEADVTAGKKPVQLEAARKAGLRTPRTLITNSRAAVEEFREVCHSDVIFKSLTAHPNRFLETRALDDKAMEYLDSLILSPVLFQERVKTGRDLRVTIMGERISAAAIDSRRSEYPLDSRIDMGVRHEAIDLNPQLRNRLLDLMNELGLIYGAVDLIETEDGEMYFLEVNPGGQFLYIELLASLPLSRHMAELLSTPPTESLRPNSTRMELPLHFSSTNDELRHFPTIPFVVATPGAAPALMKSREEYSLKEQEWKRERGLEDPAPHVPLLVEHP